VTVGEQIDAAMARKGVGPAEAARLCKVDPDTLWRVRNGKTVPQFGTVARIANALDMDFNVLWEAASPASDDRVGSTKENV
jgi:transcriptional regulator with XRE-family HTH domain